MTGAHGSQPGGSVEPGVSDTARERPLVLVLDYPGVQARGSLSAVLQGTAQVDVVNPLETRLPREGRGAEYARALVAPPGTYVGRVVAVAAQCMTAPLAQEVAAALSTPGRPVHLLLVDASPTDPELIRETFRKFVGESVAVGSKVGQIDTSWLDDATLSRRPDRALAEAAARLRELVVEAFTADGISVDESSDLVDQATEVYVAWLAHLVAAYNSTFPVWGGVAFHVVSAEHVDTGDWPGATKTHVLPVDSPARLVLRSDEARRRLGDLMSTLGAS